MSPVEPAPKQLTGYQGIVDDTVIDEIIQLASRLQGVRVLHINATEKGGGVAEILQSFIPLLNDVGMRAEWQVIEGRDDLFAITKKLHNSLQGADNTIPEEEWKTYEDYNRKFAEAIDPDEWDYIIVHDPQPLAMRRFAGKGKAKWIWRCHIDLSKPHAPSIGKVLGYAKDYDGAIFTLKRYVPDGLGAVRTGIIPVAIDPLSEKNRPLPVEEAQAELASYGIDTDRPLIAQVSRFDPWKDPLGVLEAWRLAKREAPELQLVLKGNTASDDPEGETVLKKVLAASEGLEDVHIISDVEGEADERLVRELQAGSDVIVQKSLREGFGLTVTEALWAGTPVVGGNVGGIPEQVIDGETGYLVDDAEEAATAIVELISNPGEAERMGGAGREHVRKHFLLPVMLRNHLRFLSAL